MGILEDHSLVWSHPGEPLILGGSKGMARARIPPVAIDVAGLASPLITEYAAIPSVFDVTSLMSTQETSAGSFLLTEHPVDRPYIKDYDAVGDRPHDWATRYDTSQWVLLLARVEGTVVGAATIAWRSADLDMLDGRTDLAVLWDIRVTSTWRGRGVGRRLFDAAVTWASARQCRELKIETQNINVAACRFYAAMGCVLRIVRRDAYPACPGETQFLWYKTLPRFHAPDEKV